MSGPAVLKRSQGMNENRDLIAGISVPVSLNCFTLEVVYRTCYAFTDKAYIWLSPRETDEIVVHLTAKDKSVDLDALKGEFGNALIDFALRRQVETETATFREALIKAAFSGASPR